MIKYQFSVWSVFGFYQKTPCHSHHTWHKDKLCGWSPQMFPPTSSFNNKYTWGHLLFLENRLLGASHTNLLGQGGLIKSQLSLHLQNTCLLCQKIKSQRCNRIPWCKRPRALNQQVFPQVRQAMKNFFMILHDILIVLLWNSFFLILKSA